jgi:hypothetical protein
MKRIEAIKSQVRRLSTAEALQLQDWLSDYLDTQAQLDPEFVTSIERGNADVKAGRVRVRKA